MLSTTAEYALRIMVVLAESVGEPTTSERIASLTRVPTDYAVKVLQMLARAGLVKAQRGRGGGFRLNAERGATSLLDIVNAIDPLDRINGCPLARDEAGSELCRLHARLDEIVGLVEEGLRAVTLESVLDPSGPALCRPTSLTVVTRPVPSTAAVRTARP